MCLTLLEVEVFACEENMRKQSSHWQHHTCWRVVHKCTSILRYWNQTKIVNEGILNFRWNLVKESYEFLTMQQLYLNTVRATHKVLPLFAALPLGLPVEPPEKTDKRRSFGGIALRGSFPGVCTCEDQKAPSFRSHKGPRLSPAKPRLGSQMGSAWTCLNLLTLHRSTYVSPNLEASHIENVDTLIHLMPFLSCALSFKFKIYACSSISVDKYQLCFHLLIFNFFNTENEEGAISKDVRWG